MRVTDAREGGGDAMRIFDWLVFLFMIAAGWAVGPAPSATRGQKVAAVLCVVLLVLMLLVLLGLWGGR